MSLFKTAKQRYTVDFTPVFGTLNENKLLRAQQNQEGDTDTITVYLFLATIRCRFSKKQTYAVDFPPVYGTLNEKKLLRAQQNQEGDTNIPFTVTVYLFLAKNTMSLFILTWF